MKESTGCFSNCSLYPSGRPHENIYDEYGQRGSAFPKGSDLPEPSSLKLRAKYANIDDYTTNALKGKQWDFELVTINWPTKGYYTGLPYPIGGSDRDAVEDECANACKTANSKLGYVCKA